MTRALIDPRLTTKIGNTHLGRDQALDLYRTNSDVDGEGNYVGDQTHRCTFNASIGMPTIQDLEIAAQRGTVIDTKMIFDPNQQVPDLTQMGNPLVTLSVEVGDSVWGRNRKWTIVDVFKQIVVTCHLKSFGTDTNE